jgi:hypothetical protein
VNEQGLSIKQDAQEQQLRDRVDDPSTTFWVNISMVDADGNEWEEPVEFDLETIRSWWPDCPDEIDGEYGCAILKDLATRAQFRARLPAPTRCTTPHYRAPVVCRRIAARPRERRSRRSRRTSASSSGNPSDSDADGDPPGVDRALTAARRRSA